MYCLRLPHNYWNECISSCRFLSYLPFSLIVENRWISIFPYKGLILPCRMKGQENARWKRRKNPSQQIFICSIPTSIKGVHYLYVALFFYDSHHENPLRSFPVNDANFSSTDCPHNLPPVTFASKERNKNERKKITCVAPLSCFLTLDV